MIFEDAAKNLKKIFDTSICDSESSAYFMGVLSLHLASFYSNDIPLEVLPSYARRISELISDSKLQDVDRDLCKRLMQASASSCVYWKTYDMISKE